jgi:hypothetical protein
MGSRRRFVRPAVGLLAVAVGGVACASVIAPDLGRTAAAWYHARPAALVPDVVELAEAALGDPVTAEFAVTNAGYGPLTITDVRTGCSCVGLERRVGSGYTTVRELTLAPGEVADLAVRYKAAGSPGRPMAVGVQFSTNDPDRPEVGVRLVIARIRSGLTTVPPELVFGDVPVGTPYVRRVEVRDGNDPPRPVTRVTAVGLPDVECKFVPASPSPGPPDLTDDGVLVGHLDLTVRRDDPGPFTGSIEMEAGGGGPAQVARTRVVGQAERSLRLAPSAVALPLRSDSGLRWTAACLCRLSDEARDATLVATAPEALDVRVVPGTEGRPGRVEITVRESYRGGGEQSYRVGLRAEGGGHTTEVTIPVTVSP